MRRIAIDTETHWIKHGMLAPKLVCLSWHDGSASDLVDPFKAVQLAHTWLKDPTVHIIAHNAVFDLAVLVATDETLLPLVNESLESGRIHCTKVTQQLIDLARGELMSQDDSGKSSAKVYRRRTDGTEFVAELSLAALMLWWFDEVIAKEGTWRLNYNELDGVPISDWPEEARRYAGDDAVYAWRVHEKQLAYVTLDRELFADGTLHNTRERVCAAMALHLLSLWGVRTHAEAVAQLREVLEAEQAAAAIELKDSGIYVPKKKRDPNGEKKRCMAVIYAKLKIAFTSRGMACPMTSGGEDKVDEEGNLLKKGRPPVPQTDADTLLLSGDPDLRVLALSMAGKKILDTYVPVLERGTIAPICAAYNVLVETGRSSCRHPNMQNPPRKGGVRECFIPRPGHVYVGIDFDTAELRSLAQICLVLVGYSKLGDALREGKDPHLMLAAQMLKVSYADCVKRYKAGEKEIEDMRQFCKVGNFGFPGGLGEHTFIEYAAGYGLTVSLEEAKELRNAWFATWTEMHRYFAIVSNHTGNLGGTVTQIRVGGKPGARELLPHRKRGGVYFTSAANGYFQGLTADGALHALWRVTRACYEAHPGDVLYGVRPVMFLHDEIISEVPYNEARPELASKAAYELARIMREAMAEWVPDVPILCAPAMFRKWLKGAKPVHFEGGVLVPSRPVKVLGANGKESTQWVHDKGEEEIKVAA